jgi:hypothetical protein
MSVRQREFDPSWLVIGALAITRLIVMVGICVMPSRASNRPRL